MKAAILGVGKMGTAICYALRRLGFYVVGVDSNKHAAENFRKYIGGPEGSFYLTDESTGKSFKRVLIFEKPDVVVSSLPYHQTEEVALWCVDNSIRYCDLGGRVDVSKNINEYAKKRATVPVMTDLGLAPGWVNILAEEGYRKLHGEGEIVTVEMMVGGLPDYLESNNNPLRYGITWSIDGLINEYKDDCIILEGGEIKTVKGMEGLENVETETLGKLEAFYTSGGASHSIYSMKDRGVKNCYYKTLRYRGHRDIINFLIRDCDLDDETLNKIFIKGCGFSNKDEVIILAKVHKDNKTWVEEKLIKSDFSFSAMQKATAYSISAVASLMAEGLFDGKKDQHRDYWVDFPKALSYRDIPFEDFNERLSQLGI
ncbi:hypothetical protein CL634_01760 [bacterium]|nr:hypothetical protein [bacterium]|tara:strand:+ start:239 stop:1351 length:1113 start_codon:yes stop_codon:yes gene_type:complete